MWCPRDMLGRDRTHKRHNCNPIRTWAMSYNIHQQKAIRCPFRLLAINTINSEVMEIELSLITQPESHHHGRLTAQSQAQPEPAAVHETQGQWHSWYTATQRWLGVTLETLLLFKTVLSLIKASFPNNKAVQLQRGAIHFLFFLPEISGEFSSKSLLQRRRAIPRAHAPCCRGAHGTGAELWEALGHCSLVLKQ